MDDGPEGCGHAEEDVHVAERGERCGVGVEGWERGEAASAGRGREGRGAEGEGGDYVVEAEGLVVSIKVSEGEGAGLLVREIGRLRRCLARC